MLILENGIAILEHDSHIGKWVIETGKLDFDGNVLPYLLPYINDGDTVLDAGANIGCYSFAFLNKIGEKGNVLCFEPSEESFECLVHNLGKYSNVYLYQKALGSKIGSCKIIRENNNVGMNFCEELKNGIELNVVNIDSLGLEKLDFIKIDVESYELDVLIGGYNTINKHKPTMFIEINESTLSRKGLTKLDIFGWLEKNNYSYKNIYPNQGLNDSQFDIICLHNEK